MTYATYSVFKDYVMNAASSSEFTSTAFAAHVDQAEEELNGDTGKTTTAPWTSSDGEYKTVQKAESLLVAHALHFGNYGGTSDEALDEPSIYGEAKTSNYYTEYQRLIQKINDRTQVERDINDPVFAVVETD